MTVIEEDQHGVCLYRHSINWRDELLQLSVTIEVIVAEKERQQKAEQQKSIERRTEINRRIAEEKKKKQYKSQLSLFDD